MSKTALLILDPYNDFLSPEGKIWPYLRDVAERLEVFGQRARDRLTDGGQRGITRVHGPLCTSRTRSASVASGGSRPAAM